MRMVSAGTEVLVNLNADCSVVLATAVRAVSEVAPANFRRRARGATRHGGQIRYIIDRRYARRARTSQPSIESVSCAATSPQINGCCRARRSRAARITDVDHESPRKNLHSRQGRATSPTFGHAHGGVWETINPGNEEYLKGDQFSRPGGGGGGGGAARPAIATRPSRRRFHLRAVARRIHELLLRRPGTAQHGQDAAGRNHRIQEPARRLQDLRHPVQSSTCCVRCAARWDGASQSAASTRKRLRRAEEELAEPAGWRPKTIRAVLELQHRSHTCRRACCAIPFIDPFDLRYSNRIKVAASRSTQAVMFCVMDVSGSMDEARKDTAKRFFILLYLFLTRAYDKIEVVFIRHHTAAAEVDEDEFFHSRESGGTVVSSALHLLQRIIDERYPQRRLEHLCRPGIGRRQLGQRFGALPADTDQHASCRAVQYYAYVEITDGAPQNLWASICRGARPASALCDAKNRVAVGYLSGVPRIVQEAAEMRATDHEPSDAETPTHARRLARAVGMDVRTDRAGARGNRGASPPTSASTPIRTSSKSSPPSR